MKFTVTDSSHTSGKFGSRWVIAPGIAFTDVPGMKLVAPGSPSLTSVCYLEVPIIGSGTEKDPLRIKVPEDLVQDPSFGLVNRLSLTYSALIPTMANGQPTVDKAIVRIFNTERQGTLRPFEESLLALKQVVGVREHDSIAAIKRARVIDPKLSLFDFVQMPMPGQQELEEYINLKRTINNLDITLNEAIAYLQTPKGW